MYVLVTYSSRYGSTAELAEHLAGVLRGAGQEVDVLPVKEGAAVSSYDAVVLGSAVYFGHWMKPALEFARSHEEELTNRPVWLFSSGPLGPDTLGSDRLEEAAPEELAELEELLHPRDHGIFFGRLEHRKLGLAHRALALLPAARATLPEGDFRDWPAVESWATAVANKLGGQAEEAGR